MKAVILAGGFGTRLSEETVFRPKPMVEIGGKPILWHIMNIYAAQGVNEFIIALGYKAEIIKEYFLNFYAINNDLTVDLATGKAIVHGTNQLPWTVHLVDTGLHTQTGGRLKRVEKWLEDDQTFMFNYGDGVADIHLTALVVLHRRALDYVDSDDAIWERGSVEQIARDGELMGYQHYGFWSCMDTLKEKNM